MNIGFLTVQAQEKGFTGKEPLALAATIGMQFDITVHTDAHGHHARSKRSQTDRKPKYYGQRDTDELFEKLNEFDLVVGHNLVDYAYPIIEKYDEIVVLPDDLPTLDLFTAIDDEIGIRVKLASLAESVGMHRFASGLTAVNLWQNNEFESVRQIMCNDLRILWKVFIQVSVSNEFEILHPNGRESAMLDCRGWHDMIPALSRRVRGY